MKRIDGAIIKNKIKICKHFFCNYLNLTKKGIKICFLIAVYLHFEIKTRASPLNLYLKWYRNKIWIGYGTFNSNK